ncbi:hypothetical protein GCM10014719_50240 [Planomonospora parontospora subsp. antibiotica]|nr:hypothetical protein GCM10014719_50240 [Planomonospora parontospora subsp. antibiotica]GII18554.1 hypothetical protein Ppa05_52800 [Planomonospora parontospora subsp. antibiotica]
MRLDLDGWIFGTRSPAAQMIYLNGIGTLGFDPARFQTKPPACYRASWQLPGPDFHRQATTSLRTTRSTAISRLHLLLCWTHEKRSMDDESRMNPLHPALV